MTREVGLDFLEELMKYGVVYRKGTNGMDHAILSQKQGQPMPKHSPLFANLRAYLQNAARSRRAAKRLIAIIDGLEIDLGEVKAVVASSNSAIQFNRTFAELIGVDVDDVFTDKDKNGIQVWNGGFWVGDKLVFHLEELITTMATGHNVYNEIIAKTRARMFGINGRHLVGTLFLRPETLPRPTRSNLYPVDYKGVDYDVVTVTAIEVPTYWANECKLCDQGSAAVPGRQLVPEVAI